MRIPRGFGKNYFTLAAIQAYSSASVLHARDVRTQALAAGFERESESEEEADDSPDLLLCTAQSSIPHPSRACHCNCYYKRKTRNIIKNHPLAKKFQRPYRLTNSTLSPPIFLS